MKVKELKKILEEVDDDYEVCIVERGIIEPLRRERVEIVEKRVREVDGYKFGLVIGGRIEIYV